MTDEPVTDEPVLSADDVAAQPVIDLPSFSNDDGVDLGMIAVEVIREYNRNLAVRVVVRGDIVFQAKLKETGPGNDPWLAGKAEAALQFGMPSLQVRLSHEESGAAFTDRTDVDHAVVRARGGSFPIRVNGETVGTVTTSGEPDTVDHATTAEAVERFLAQRAT